MLGCLALSCSTDTFSGGDDGGDGGGGDATSDGPGVTDGALKDVITGGDGGSGDAANGCYYVGQPPNCGGGSWCNVGDQCCANDGGAQCTNNPCNGTSFLCRDTADCSGNDSGIFTCCLFAAMTPDVCPRTIKGTGNAQAACVAPSSCTGTRLCTSTSECTSLGKTCQRANIGGANNGITFGVCL
jgi:hypothetical protein